MTRPTTLGCLQSPPVISIILIAWFASLGGTDGFESRSDPTTEPIHERVLWVKDPSSEAVVSWSTRAEGKHHRVYYDRVARGGVLEEYAHMATSFKDGQFTMRRIDERWARPAYYHHVHLRELAPDTTYYLVMASDENQSREYHFRTAPADDQSFAILFGGDSRIGLERGRSTGIDPYEHKARQAMNRRMRSLLEEYPHILALAHGGDFCLEAEWRYLDRWLGDHELVITSEGRLLPVIPARGNHDRQIGFEELFPWPGLDRNYYYVTQLSPAAALITLNTNLSLAGNQRNWLEQQLAKLRPGHRWVLAQYHQPAYPSVRDYQSGAGVRRHFVPLFEQYHIDLVCESHDHAIKRTLPIRDGKAVEPEIGVVYIGDGGLGVPQRVPDTSRWYLQEPGFTKGAHHVQMLEFSADELRIRAFGVAGEMLDDHRLKPRAAVLQQ